MKILNKKKASASAGGVIALTVGVSVAVMVLILVGSLGGKAYLMVEPDLNQIGEILTQTNYSFTINNATYTSIGQSFIVPDSVVLKNMSATLSSAKYTINYEDGKAIISSGQHSQILNASYSYYNKTIQGTIKSGVLSTFRGLDNTASYLPIIVMAIIFVMVIGGITVSMKGSNNGGSAL